MSKISTKTIVIAAITLALTVVMAYFPIVFMLPLLFTCCTRNMKMSLFMGLCFGITSLVYSLFGGSIIAVAFMENPWIPIIPRIFVAFFAHGSFVLARKLIKPSNRIGYLTPYFISAGVGSLSNTALIVSCLLLFAKNSVFGDVTVMVFVPTMLIYALIEFAVYLTVVPIVSVSVETALLNKRLPPKKTKIIAEVNEKE